MGDYQSQSTWIKIAFKSIIFGVILAGFAEQDLMAFTHPSVVAMNMIGMLAYFAATVLILIMVYTPNFNFYHSRVAIIAFIALAFSAGRYILLHFVY